MALTPSVAASARSRPVMLSVAMTGDILETLHRKYQDEVRDR